MMKIYETASGRLLTRTALRIEAFDDAAKDWDPSMNRVPFSFDFDDWLIEAINTGVIKERELIDR
jgi:hypothetical protein